MSDMPRCPECWVELTAVDVWPTKVWGCGRCGGIWLNNTASQMLVKNPDPRVLELAARAAANAAHPGVDGHEPRPCPLCQKDMTLTPVWEAQVRVDVCTEHGTWFDSNEIQAVARVAKAKAAPVRSVRSQPTGQVSEAEIREFRRALRTSDDDSGFETGTVGGAVLGIALSLLMDE